MLKSTLAAGNRVLPATVVVALAVLLGPPCLRAEVPRSEHPHELDWAKSLGDSSRDFLSSTAQLGDGGVVVTGWFSDRTDLDPASPGGELTSAGWQDAFVARFAPDGTLIWVGHLAGPQAVTALSLRVARNGSILIGGVFDGQADLDPGPAAAPHGSPLSIRQGFVLSLDEDGTYQWATVLPCRSEVHDIATASDGGLWVAGPFAGTCHLEAAGSSLTLASAGADDVFLLRLGQDGSPISALRFGGTSTDSARAIALDFAGNLTLAGTFFGAVDFDPGPGLEILTSSRLDAYVLQLDPEGALRWSRRIGGSENDYASALTVDSTANVYLAGQFSGSADLDPGSAESWFTSGGPSDYFLVCLRPDGDLSWALTSGGPATERVTALAAGDGGLFAAGTFSKAMDFDPGTAEFQLAPSGLGASDVFVLNLRFDGTFQWGIGITGTGTDAPTSISTGHDAVVVAGNYGQTADFDPGVGVFSMTARGLEDMFIARLFDIAVEPLTLSVPGDFSRIQQAVDASRHGDTILVGPGTYLENIDFRGQHIDVISTAGPLLTRIKGNGQGPVVTFRNAEGRSATLQGFTISGGKATGGGGGIAISSFGSPTIVNNFIIGNEACSAGGGVTVISGHPLLQGNVLLGNRQTSGCVGGRGGGGVAVENGIGAQIIGNLIADNSWNTNGGGVSLWTRGVVDLQDNRILGNHAAERGGGVYLRDVPRAEIVQNIIAHNHATEGGGVYWLISSNPPRGPRFANNTVYSNVADVGSAFLADGLPGLVPALVENNIMTGETGEAVLWCASGTSQGLQITSNDIWSSTVALVGGSCAGILGSAGNISEDPLFVDAGDGNLRLQQGSPAVDAGVLSAFPLPQRDLGGGPRIEDGDGDGTAVIDMGVFELCPEDCLLFFDDFESGDLDAWGL